MKRFILITSLSLFALNLIIAQCDPPPSQFCGGGSPLCSVDELDGYACRSAWVPNPTGPDPLCAGMGTPENTLWWSFLGNGDFIGIRIVIDENTCMGMSLGCIGLEAGIVSNCFGTTLDCNANCDTTRPAIIEIGGLTVPCQVYYLWIDGCCGDVCDFTLETMSTGPPSLPDPLPIPEVQGRVCPCGITEVCIGELADVCPVNRQWTIDGVVLPDFDDLDCLEFEVGTDGSLIEVCVIFTLGNPLDSTAICDQDMSCVRLTPEPIPMIFEGDIYACYEDHLGGGYVWHDSVIFTSCIDPPCRIRAQQNNDCCADYEARITILEEREYGERYEFFCDKSDLPLRTEDGSLWTTEACGVEITFPDPDFHFCDSTYILYLSFFDPKVTLTQECENCDGFTILKAEVEYEPECIFGDIDWTGYWVNEFLDTVGIGEVLIINKAGTYFYQLHVVYTDDESGKVQQCDLEGLPLWSIKALDIEVDTPIISGTTPVCPSTIGTYKLDSAFQNPCEYRWSIKQGGGVIITESFEDSTSIQVDWTNLSGPVGQVCVNVLTDCSTSPDTCFLVEFLEAPKPDAGPDAILCRRDYKMKGTIDASNGRWEIVDAPGDVMYDENDITTDISVNQNGEYIFVWKESILDCEGIDTVKIIFSTDPIPGPIDTICSNDASDYTIVFNILEGSAPYTIIQGGGSIDANNQYTSDPILINLNHSIIIRDTFGCEFELIINHECKCPNEIGIISSDTIKSCGISDVSIDYNSSNMVLGPMDTIHYILYSVYGDLINSELIRNHSGTFTFDPNTMTWGQVYFLGVATGRKDQNDYVDYLDGCVKIAEGQPVIWLEMPTPDAGNDIDICSSQIDLFGIQSLTNSNIKWANTPGSIITDPNSAQTMVTVSDFGQYTFVFTEENGFCIAQDSVTINFYESPDISNIIKDCIDLGTSTEWKYSVNIDRGSAPYTIIDGNGSFDPTTGIFTSNNLESLERDTLIVEDINGCRDTISLVHNCECGLTKSGTMNTSLSSICIDSCVTVHTNNDHGQEADDCVYMILHTDSANVDRNKIIDIQLFNSLGNTFCFNESLGMIPNVIYYVSYVVGECDPNGDIRLDDACLKIISKPVQFIPYPTPDAGQDQNICGLFTQFNAIPSLGNGTWTLTNSPIGSNAIFDRSLPASNLSVDQYGSYTFIWTEDNNGCDASDEITIVFHDSPIYKNIQFECDSVGENYRITFEIENGDNASWSATDITGWKATNISGNVYRTPWIMSGNSVNITITDKYDCNPSLLSQTHVCDCITDPGRIELSPNVFCVDGEGSVNHIGFTTDANDVVVYYLHEGDINNIGNVILSNTTGNFSFDPTKMQLNRTYYITVRVGSKNTNGDIDLNDRCLVQTLGIPIIWYDDPSPRITSLHLTLTCTIDTIELDGSGSIINSGVGNLLFEWSTSDGKFDANSNLNNDKVLIVRPGTYTLLTTNDSTGCSESINYIIDEDRPHINVDAGSSAELTCDRRSVILDGSNSDLGNNIDVEWIGPGINSSNKNDIKPSVSVAGVYTLILTDRESDCKDSDEVVVTEDYTTPTANIQAIGDLTCEIKSIMLDGRQSNSVNGIRSYTWSTSNGNIVGNATLDLITIDAPGLYTLIVIDDKTGCSDTLSFEAIELDNTLDAISAEKQDILCNGQQNGSISINNVIGGINPLLYSLNNGPFTNQTEFNDLPAGIYHVVVKDDNGCEIDTFITIDEPSIIDISAKEDQNLEFGDDINLDTMWKDLVGTTSNETGTEIYWLDENGNRVNPNQQNLSLPKYTFTVVVVNKNGCEARDELNIFVKIERHVYIPNIFAPQSNGALTSNKKFLIYSAPGSINRIIKFHVFDRWGEMVFHNSGDILFDQNGTSESGWDGTLNGKLLNPAVYVYYIELEYADYGNGTELDKVYGAITLVR